MFIVQTPETPTNAERPKLYLLSLAAACREVAINPQPKLLQYLAELLWRAPATLAELSGADNVDAQIVRGAR